MTEERLKQFEKSLKDKIDECNNNAKTNWTHSERGLSRYYKNKSEGCQEALDMLYKIYPELKEN